MIWFFTKGSERLRILTALDESNGEFVVEIHWPDRAADVHRFASESLCQQFLTAFDSELTSQAWRPEGVGLAGPRTTLH